MYPLEIQLIQFSDRIFLLFFFVQYFRMNYDLFVLFAFFPTFVRLLAENLFISEAANLFIDLFCWQRPSLSLAPFRLIFLSDAILSARQFEMSALCAAMFAPKA